jgi:O-methyltransferase involved in polyketide biosynthesis
LPPTRNRRRAHAASERPQEPAGAPGLLQRAQLPAVPSTLLIPLAARARGDRYFPWLACGDAVARELLERLGADVEPYLDDLHTVLNVLWRTRVIRQAAQQFFGAHPRAGGVNLGCGLSHHFQWLDTGANRWLDADLPEVMALRAALLPVRSPRGQQAEVDLARPGWWQRLSLPQPGATTPVFVVCEGVLMYLEPVQVQAVLHEFAQCAPAGSRMVLDVMTHRAVGAGCRHASVGPTGAEFRWGVARMADLSDAHPRLRLLGEHSVAQCYGWPGLALETLWRPWLGAPLYGMVELELSA